ncbi:MAG: helix-turn-helix transcriptional regulator [Lentisphaeria bacterium]|nr:helix-turn-helix domain-containing protein [Lentisphaerota bacterium]MBR7144001.1 helix-turn-helix transcriptional regulator [Lentisphaeria bacterium]
MQQYNTPDLPELGANVKRERIKRNWTQDELAKFCGVSKAMLSQVESGKVNPTIGTLWKIASALEVELNFLLRGKPEVLRCFEVGRSADLPVLLEGSSNPVRIKVLSGVELLGKLEFYHLTFPAGAVLESSAHYPGSEEIITVISGKADVVAGERSTGLNAGDVLRFACDVPHKITNSCDQKTEIHMIVRFTAENNK